MTLNKIKLCCIIHSLKAGGMERVMVELVNNFAMRDNVDVHLVLYGKNREIFYSVDSAITIHTPRFEFRDSQRTLSTIHTMLWLRKEIKKISPSYILSFGEYWNNLVLLSLYGLSVPIFISDRSQPDKNLGVLHNFLRRYLYKKAGGVICQTNQAKSIMLKRYAYKNIIVIGNPIRDIKKQENMIRENIIISIGRLIDTKHFNRLITVFSKLNSTSWRLVIIGGNDNKQNNLQLLKEQIKTLNLEKNVLLEGYQKNIDDYLLRSKIFVFMSSSEGFPNVIGEAMSAGLPVISYDCIAGPRDLIENGKNGYLIPVFEDALFLEKMKYLMTDESERDKMGQYAKQCMTKYEPNIICEKYFQFITNQKCN